MFRELNFHLLMDFIFRKIFVVCMNMSILIIN